MSILNEILGDFSGGKMLDVATGDGTFIQVLVSHLKDYSEIVGIDTDQKMIEHATKQCINDKITYEYMSGDALDFEDASFDTVSISNSLHHLTDIRKTLDEMYRVLKPGGLFIINEILCDHQNEKQLTHVYFHHLQAEIESLQGILHNKTFTKQQVIDIAESIGLKGLEVFIYDNEIFNQYVRIDMFANRYEAVLEKIKERPEYPKYRLELEKLIARLQEVGVEFASQLMYIGRKE